MVNSLLCSCLFRVVLPLVLLIAVIFRFNFFSFIYLLILLLAPIVPGPTSTSNGLGHISRYLKVILGLSTLSCLSHVVFQGVLLSLGDYGKFPVQCTRNGRLLALIGLHGLDGIQPLDALRLMGLDFIVLLTTVGVLATSEKFSEAILSQEKEHSEKHKLFFRKKKRFPSEFLAVVREFVFLVLLAGAGILHPSLISSSYFLLFLSIATWLACNQRLGHTFILVRTVLAIYCASNIIVLYLYQLDYAQKLIHPKSKGARLLGLLGLVDSSCSSSGDSRTIIFRPEHWTVYIQPLVLLGLYWLLCFLIRYKLHADLLEDDNGTYPEDPSQSKDIFAMDINGSVIFSTDGNTSDGDSDDEVSSIDITKSLYFSLFTCLFRLVKKGSYIGTLIIMMTWSITYHSWLTFILLLWSCVVWMLPNSRQACLRTSPFFVAYAESLLLLQYIYGLNLRDCELPNKIETVNLEQLGLVKYYELSYQPLAVKIMYTIVFWVTLRQFVEEKRLEANRDISERVMMERFNVLNCRYPALHHRLSVATSKGGLYVRRLGVIVKNLLVKYWICVVTCMLMVISLGGEKVVMYRIPYMFLCLFFILVFQFSYSLWRKIMYSFWLTVIVYSMLVLIMIYTYQFENFENYWTNYLGISLQYQKDIGLEKYVDNPAILFLKLLIPTFFLIITIIQLHYFHKEFLLISGFDCRNKISDSSINQTNLATSPEIDATKIVMREINETEEYATVSAATSLADASFTSIKTGHEKKGADEDIKTLKRWFHLILERAVIITEDVSDMTWQFLDIHVIKIVLFSVLWLALHDVCAVHLLFVIFVIVALPFKALETFVSHCCSVWAAVLLLTKMIYQLKFVDQYGWMVNCSDMNYVDQNTSVHPSLLTETVDNRKWVGFRKTDNLLDYCKGYIGVILILTLQAVVKVRQKLHRFHKNEKEPLEKVMFPGVTRAKADVGLLECFKFLSNYAFYKFGIEVCFVTIVICIGVRLDVYAVISALWLCGLFLLRRKVMNLVWPFYVAYQCIILPIQYLMCLGIPAGFCIEYPWSISSVFNEELREWLYLPDFKSPPDSNKILVDFFQLLFACCQLHVFAIENNSEENGGNNSEIWLLTDPKDLINPIPDFVTYTKSYLDMLKVLFFFSFYWITLAVVFLAGTSRVSLFGMGYVVGCFLFLWNGNEFYLKPLKTLLRIWNCLLAYNVIVIFLKSILEVISCVFLSSLYKNLCWLVQLLGIVCIKKLSIDSKSDTNNMVRNDGCTAPVDEAGLLWDGICFVFLLLQKRLFCSYYFQHLVVETEVQKLLASRGAILINENKIKEVHKQHAAESEIMEKIKKKMDKILSRANQQKARGQYKEPESHFQAIRAGDYYMLEDVNDEDLDLELLSSKTNEDEDEDPEVKKKGLNALLSQTLRNNHERDVDEVKKSPSDFEDHQSIENNSTASGFSQTQPVSQLHLHLSSPEDMEHQSTQNNGINTISLKRQAQMEIPVHESILERIGEWVEFGIAFLLSLLISATAKLNHISKDYRYVAYKLSLKKKYLKKEHQKRQRNGSLKEPNVLETCKETTIIWIDLYMNSKDFNKSPGRFSSSDAIKRDFEKNQPTILRFLVACYYAIVSHSDVLCYFIIVINQLKSASLLSLPLPIMVFLWGTLSVPRPSKTFWITIITYTEVVVLIKYLFQFDFFPWNVETHVNAPFWAPRILGIEKKNNYAVYDLALLLVVFFHRFVLKSLGLWKDEENAQSSSREVLDEKSNVLSSELMADRPESDRDWLLVCVEGQKGMQQEATDRKTDETGRSQDSEDLLGSINQYGDICKPDEQKSEDRKTSSNFCRGLFRKFFVNLLSPEYRVTVDVYALMFLCEFVNFLIVVFGYWAFGTDRADGGVASYVEENKVPVPFLIMLIAQFALIVIDRALYLRKCILGKLIFQIILVFVVHMWMFFILPAVTEREFTSPARLPPKLWYFIKCIYLLLSAYQIRSGYPTRILGILFCKEYNYINYFLFKGYMMIPFLYELRSLMDWIWTHTSLNVSNWLKMEDIFTNIYLLKCIRRVEAEYPTPRGVKRAALIKYGVGGLLLFLIILIIWFPLLLFALGNTVRLPNTPYDCTVEITVEGYEPIFKMSAQRSSLKPVTQNDWDKMLYYYRSDSSAQSFLANYDVKDVTLIELNGNSTSVWSISPPSQSALIAELLSNETELNVKLSWSFSRESKASDIEKTVHNEHIIKLDNVEHRELREKLADVLNSGNDAHEIKFPYLFPKYLKVPGRGQPSLIKDLVSSSEHQPDTDEKLFRNLSLRLRHVSFGNLSVESRWWEVQEQCSISGHPYSFLSPRNCHYLQLIAFSEKIFPSELSALSGYGIVGLYTTFVLVVSRVVRGAVTGTSFKIIYSDMPYVDRVLQLCLDIYLVRESREFSLEEDLYAKLLFLYRSPENLIAWTRYPQLNPGPN